MPSSLIVVESPTKVKTIKKFVGEGFDVRATMGHIKDLPKSGLGIDVEKDFTPTYRIIEAKKKALDEIRKASRNVEAVYLAPDPDREGEAIAWHVAEEIDQQGKQIFRVLFNDLTRNTVLEAIGHPQQLDRNKYEAQQTRRILDRLVGYKISPLLWSKVKRGLSAGRVQSVAVRLICDREEEIRAFKPEEYWNIMANLAASQPPPFE
ncbi:MAG: DNA topoisomerase, partial [Syntrophales bacterium]|nr:DNA topoisomerase [Syntrophales bacterium]